MTEREDNVYKAKLAEQAERYDGKQRNILYNLVCIYVYAALSLHNDANFIYRQKCLRFI